MAHGISVALGTCRLVARHFSKYFSAAFTNMSTKEDASVEKATLGMACFWLPDGLFGVFPGVIRTKVGYSGGTKKNPTYTSLGDHTEVIQIDYDPQQTNYNKILDFFWKNHDPTTTAKRQYMSAIFYHNEDQKALAEKTLAEQEKLSTKPITTKILPLTEFYIAEDYHQKHSLQKHPELVRFLGVDSKGLVNSTVCARLNGYLSGHGSLKDFEHEYETLGLDEKQANYVREVLKSNKTDLSC